MRNILLAILIILVIIVIFSISKNYSLAASAVVKIGNIQEFKPGTIKFIPQAKSLVISDQEGIYAISAVCTHAGCLIGYQGKKLACPCHGANFDISGKVLAGPAKKDLDWYALQIDKGGNLFLDTTKVINTGQKILYPQKLKE